MPRYIYHYYATCQLPASCEIINIDGIAVMEKEIANMVEYRRLKEIIAKNDQLPLERVIIKNLSLLKKSPGFEMNESDISN